MIVADGLKALIFDMDDTLVVEKASAEAALLQTCELAKARHGVEPHDLLASVRQTCRTLWHGSAVRTYCVEIGISSWEALWARFEGDNENLQFLRQWAPTYRLESWRQALARHSICDDELAAGLAETFPLHRRRLNVVYEDALPMLERLRPRYRLALLTNGAPDLQREKLAGAGLAHWFDEVLVSGDIGFGKPNPRVYETMLTRLDVAPDEALMIGNSLHSDIAGAQAAGIRAVWVNREASVGDEAVSPDIEVPDLDRLATLLSR